MAAMSPHDPMVAGVARTTSCPRRRPGRRGPLPPPRRARDAARGGDVAAHPRARRARWLRRRRAPAAPELLANVGDTMRVFAFAIIERTVTPTTAEFEFAPRTDVVCRRLHGVAAPRRACAPPRRAPRPLSSGRSGDSRGDRPPSRFLSSPRATASPFLLRRGERSSSASARGRRSACCAGSSRSSPTSACPP